MSKPVYIHNATNAELIEAAQGSPIPKTLEGIGKKWIGMWIEDFRYPGALFWVLSNRAGDWLSRYHWHIFIANCAEAAVNLHVSSGQKAQGLAALKLAKGYAGPQPNTDIQRVIDAIDKAESIRDELQTHILTVSASSALGAACSAARYVVSGDPVHAAHVYEFVKLAKSDSRGMVNIKKLFNDRYVVDNK